MLLMKLAVDTMGAGDGELLVEVTYMGQAIASRMIQQGRVYQVSFMPEGAGVYNVHVYYARMDVPGEFIS